MHAFFGTPIGQAFGAVALVVFLGFVAEQFSRIQLKYSKRNQDD